jgi:hypothetical protein
MFVTEDVDLNEVYSLHYIQLLYDGNFYFKEM